MKRILVTGGAGYIGSVCVKRLLDDGYAVVVADNLSKGKLELVDQRATFKRVDLATDDLAPLFAEPVDAVIHFAAYKAVEESMEDAVKYSANILGVTRVLNAMVKHEVKKIVFSSTAAVYGDPEYSPMDEQHPTRPVNFYGETKLLAESLFSWYQRIHGIEYVALRYFNVVGDILGYVDPEAKNVLPIIMEVATGKRPAFTIFGDQYDTRDGTCIRDYIDVADLVDAHVRALGYEASAIINLGTGDGVSVKELVEMTKEAIGKDIPIKIAGPRKGDPASVVASNARAKELLDWSPEVPLKVSIKKTWQAYQTSESS